MNQRCHKPDALIRRYLGRRSIREVARSAGIDHAMISRWARGLTRPDICSAGYLAFCGALDLTREQRCALALSLGADPLIVGKGGDGYGGGGGYGGGDGYGGAEGGAGLGSNA